MKFFVQNSYPPSFIGLLQALGIMFYTGLIAGLFRFIERVTTRPPGYMGIVFLLFLLVFSAAITGLIVFGYPAVLTINKRVKEALNVLAYTLMYSLVILVIILLLVFTGLF